MGFIITLILVGLVLIFAEILLIPGNIILDFLQCMAAGEIVRILTVRQKHYLHVHTLFQHQADTSERRLYTCTITIVDDRYIVRELSDQTDLIHSKGRAAGSHYIIDSQLVH